MNAMPRRTPPDPEGDQAGPFPEAAAIHERILSTPNEYPTGWFEQARFRERYDLPPFQPPRFKEGTWVHDVVTELSSELDVKVEFVRPKDKRGDWYVEVNGELAFRVNRYRDDAANTVVRTTPEEFATKVRESIDV